MKKLLIIVAIVLVVLVGLATSGWWWLTATQSGAQFLLNRAAGVVPSLSWTELDGSLRGGLTLDGLEIDEPDLRASVGRTELAVRIHLLPTPRVDVGWLRTFDVEVHLAEGEEPPIEPEPFALPDLSSPIEIRVQELLVEALDLHLPDPEAEPIRVDRLSLAAVYHDRLTLESLELAMPDLDASLSGHWGLSEPFGGDLNLLAGYRIQPDLEQVLEARVVGDLGTLEIDLDARGPATVSGSVELDEVLDDLEARIDLAGRLGDWPDVDVAVEDLSLSGSGGLEAWAVELSGRAVGPEIPTNRFDFDLAGNLEAVEVRQGRIEVLDGTVDLDGRVNLGEAVEARLGVALDALDFTELFPDWPDQARLNGRLALEATPEVLTIENLELTAPPAPLNLSGQGRWLVASEEMDLDLQWRDLDWPPVLDDSEPLLRSRTGSVRLSGPLEDWQLELEAVLRLLDQPEARIETAARGSLSGAEIEAMNIDAGPAGTARASGEVQWDPQPSGRLALDISDFDVGAFVPDVPGRVNAELAVDAPSLSELQVDLQRLDGELLNQPLSGQGRIDLADEAAAGGQMALSLGDNRLELDSDDGRLWRFDVLSEGPDQLLPALTGQLSANGQVDLDGGRAELQADFDDGGFGEITLGQARLAAHLDFLEERPGGQLKLNLNDVDLSPWERIDTVELTLDGDCLGHQLALNLAGQRGTVDLGASGALDGCEPNDLTAWSGAIDRLFIGNTPAGDWELNQPLEVAVSPQRVTASRGCLVEAADRVGRICLREFEAAEAGRAAIGIEQLPMDLLLVPLDPDFNLTTPLSGELEAAWSEAAGLERVAGFLQLDSGELRPLGEEERLLGLELIRVDFTPEPDYLKVTLQALLEGDSELNGEARIADLNDPASATVDAQTRLNLPDIGVFNRLVPELDQLAGRLSGEMAVSGDLLAPDLNGQLRLDEGRIVNAPIGLRIEDIELALDGTEQQATLTGSMRGGEGHMNVRGELELVDEQWHVETTVDGERFTFADVNWLRLQASPEIYLSRDGDGLLTLDGDIRIDQLRAGLPPGVEQRVNVSPDVRVRGEVDEEEDISDLAQRLQGRLGLDLGDDARTSALGMQARLAGDLELLWDRQTIEPRARGVIRIPSGSYRAYGQNLEIEDGEVVFTGHAIDNPSLNIEAVREIFGDPQVEKAGVRIRGNARDPRITLFTDPPTSEEKALAYVVTGANFDHASGQAAINVGFYLLPRLFVSYGIGLFEAGNVLSGRFELSQRWGVRVVSGERDTGVDLSFAIDR